MNNDYAIGNQGATPVFYSYLPPPPNHVAPEVPTIPVQIRNLDPCLQFLPASPSAPFIAFHFSTHAPVQPGSGTNQPGGPDTDFDQHRQDVAEVQGLWHTLKQVRGAVPAPSLDEVVATSAPLLTRLARLLPAPDGLEVAANAIRTLSRLCVQAPDGETRREIDQAFRTVETLIAAIPPDRAAPFLCYATLLDFLREPRIAAMTPEFAAQKARDHFGCEFAPGFVDQLRQEIRSKPRGAYMEAMRLATTQPEVVIPPIPRNPRTPVADAALQQLQDYVCDPANRHNGVVTRPFIDSERPDCKALRKAARLVFGPIKREA